MFLLIDTSVRDSISLSLFDTDTKKDVRVMANNRMLLFHIDAFLKQEGKTVENIEGIMVLVGEGSFTSTRLAVSVANTFGYARKIPLLSLSKSEAQQPQTSIASLIAQPIGLYLSATYSGVPQLGIVV